MIFKLLVVPFFYRPPEEYLYDDESDEGSGDEEDSEYIKPRRQHWANKLQFVLACVGYSVGLGSIWRFPYLCYKSGGAVFLIPYAIIMVFIGGPMLYMELAVGQFTGRGPIGALGHLCPLFKGTGLGSVVISFLMSTYYSVIIAYGVYYFFTSFRAKQPWEDCSHRWNTKHCWIPFQYSQNQSKPLFSQSPAEEFYDRKVLQIGSGIEDTYILRWELVACLICAWVLIYFAIWKSIKSSAKVRYFTATFPFVIIIILLIKSLTLEGADMGMRYFFKPKFELLLEAKVWVNAASQTFNSMGCAFGSMICFASYNKYNNNILVDTIAVWLVNGPGLIFVVYPQAMAKMPASQLWAVFFFFMLICLSLNSQFAIVEVVVTSIQDGFPISGDTKLFHFQKFKNSIKSDLLEKCPKCDEMDCDCIINDDDVGPMLVMLPSDIKQEENLSAIPFYTPVRNSPILPRGDTSTYPNSVVTSPSDTLSQYDNVNNIQPNTTEHK
ncbi:hypothetical protein NQ314_006002 [Rhamnusium bicolor]|uniref:Transporter n=1 Tax=Rhamnusium bicolor TaxID=1586634 RepID=A0AAV8ZC82_9CUCU|nr:hypothetical protein NQ314_006002 [Rhamnusium bicolor]